MSPTRTSSESARHLVAKQGIDSGPTAAHHRMIDRVIVHERRQMNQLGDRGKRRRP
jgi:hypothetical protein